MEITSSVFVQTRDRVTRYLQHRSSGSSKEQIEDAFMTALSVLLLKDVVKDIQTDEHLTSLLCVVSRNWLIKQAIRNGRMSKFNGQDMSDNGVEKYRFERKDHVAVLIGSLPKRSQEVLHWLMETDSIEETAKILHSRPDTIQRSVNRSVLLLRKKMKKV
jgi:DNA-directed RNA polymerase specialized sigma24 family protein